MRLTLLLFGLYLKLWFSVKTNQAFRNYIGNICLRILIKTEDNKRGRLLIFEKGKIKTLRGARHESDVAMVWADPVTAFKVLLSMSEEAMFNAAARGKVRIEGMTFYIQWFNDGMKLIM